MGANFQADIPGNEHLIIANTASAATNGAAALDPSFIFEAPQDLTVTEVAWIPTSGTNTGHATSYRTLRLVDGGAAGTGTSVIASFACIATKASLAPVDFTVTTSNAAIDDGDVLLFSQAVNTTAGGHTALAGGKLQVRYRVR